MAHCIQPPSTLQSLNKMEETAPHLWQKSYIDHMHFEACLSITGNGLRFRSPNHSSSAQLHSSHPDTNSDPLTMGHSVPSSSFFLLLVMPRNLIKETYTASLLLPLSSSLHVFSSLPVTCLPTLALYLCLFSVKAELPVLHLRISPFL